MPLSQEEAQRVIAAAHARAVQIGIRVTVAVVDEGGLLLSLSRMDGAPPLSAQIAEANARHALTQEIDRPRCRFGEIEDAILHERAAVVDAHADGAAALEVLHVQ